MKRLMATLILILAATTALADPTWYECSVKWAGAGGGGVYIVLVNPLFPTLLGPEFPAHSIMVSGGNNGITATRYLAIALIAMNAGLNVAVYTEPLSFSEVGGMYMVTP